MSPDSHRMNSVWPPFIRGTFLLSRHVPFSGLFFFSSAPLSCLSPRLDFHLGAAHCSHCVPLSDAQQLDLGISVSKATRQQLEHQGSLIPGFSKLVQESREACFFSPVERDETENKPQPPSVLIMQRHYSASTTNPSPREPRSMVVSPCKGFSCCALWGQGACSDLITRS